MHEASKAMYTDDPKPADPPGRDTVQIKNVGPVEVPREVGHVAWCFVQLQAMRHQADYNSAQPTAVRQGNAITYMRSAFTYWRAIRGHEVARAPADDDGQQHAGEKDRADDGLFPMVADVQEARE